MERLIEQIAAHFKMEVDALKLEPIRHGSRQKHNVCHLKFGSVSYLLKQHDVTVPVSQQATLLVRLNLLF